jgi:alanyl-tRNA synthetase
MTERLYYADSHLLEFEADVVDVASDRLYLDRTAFYPTSGGQPHDTGELTLEGGRTLRVLDVVDEGERIAHLLAEPIDAGGLVGARARGRVDRSRRLDHVQQHSGQHLLSALLYERLGLNTVSVHFGAQTSTIDLDAAELAPEVVREIEAAANDVVLEDRPVRASERPVAEVGALRGGAPSRPRERLRVVSIEGIDESACGGTHVRRTSEIGPVLARKLERVKRRCRLEFICGRRALARARTDYELLVGLGRELGCGFDDLKATVAARSRELAERTQALRKARVELSAHRAQALHREAPLARGLRTAVHTPSDDGEERELAELARAYAELPRGIFVGAIPSSGTLLLAASADSQVDAGEQLRAALREAGGKGGGSPRFAQGRANDAAALDVAVRALEGSLGLDES